MVHLRKKKSHLNDYLNIEENIIVVNPVSQTTLHVLVKAFQTASSTFDQVANFYRPLLMLGRISPISLNLSTFSFKIFKRNLHTYLLTYVFFNV